MRIAKEHIDKIHAIFRHMQLVTLGPAQQYSEADEYRQWAVIGKTLRSDGSADIVYCHAAKLTPWQKRIWEKRKKEVPYRAFLVNFEKENVYRLGFTSYPE